MEFIQLTGAIGGVLCLGAYALWRNCVSQRAYQTRRLAELTQKIDAQAELTYEEYAEANSLRLQLPDYSTACPETPEAQALVAAMMMVIGVLFNITCIIGIVIRTGLHI